MVMHVVVRMYVCTCTTTPTSGCGKLWVTDGIWKTVFPHCMFRVEVCVHSVNDCRSFAAVKR